LRIYKNIIIFFYKLIDHKIHTKKKLEKNID
jgi:hypothetical protein